MCDCEKFNSQLVGVIPIGESKATNSLSIEDYIKNKEYIDNKFKIVCAKGQELIFCSGEQNKPYFRHKNNRHGEMSEWHKKWQSRFEKIEQNIKNNYGCGRADAIDGPNDINIIEFQHSYISRIDVNKRTEFYKKNGKNVFWVIDCNNAVEKIEFKTFLLTFYITWKYESFIDIDYIYLDICDEIYKINPKLVKYEIIDVHKNNKKSIDEFKFLLKNNNTWEYYEEISQCDLYYNQRGAGCGKTYESIQLLQDERFYYKECFIYLVKMHSAREVIYNELKDQFKDKKLLNIDILFNNDEKLSDKKYVINFKLKNDDKIKKIIIATIDSFMYVISNKNGGEYDNDYYYGLVKEIVEKQIKLEEDNNINFASQKLKINKKCLMIIDETQDLQIKFIDALCKIINSTNMDIYTIGDKLQSILHKDNVYTFLGNENKEEKRKNIETLKNKYGVNIIESQNINHVKRFHNNILMNFVNEKIDFKKYSLPKIEKICDKEYCDNKHCNKDICNEKHCKIKHEDIDPIIFEIPSYKILKKSINVIEKEKLKEEELKQQLKLIDENNEQINDFINKVIKYMKDEIDKNNYLPNDFMFIFPFVSKNTLANLLIMQINEFWINKFTEEEYQNKVLKNNEFWKNNINNDNGYLYVELHKSNEGCSIDLKTSEYKTRMLSIHASKGLGAKVVFVIGLSDFSLFTYSNNIKNIIYDSLLHVALTRQKKSLYIGIEKNYDNIYDKFWNLNVDTNSYIEPNIEYIKNDINNKKISQFVHVHNDGKLFKNIKHNIVNNLNNNILENNDTKIIIDWGHHIIRYCIFYYKFLFLCYNDTNTNTKHLKQLFMTLKNISECYIRSYEPNNYKNQLFEMYKKNIKKDLITMIPILKYSEKYDAKYKRYENIIVETAENIKNKLKEINNTKKLPELCPIEMVILVHLIKIYKNNLKSEIQIYDIYDIIYYYEQCAKTLKDCHKFNCKCLSLFDTKNDINPNAYQNIRNGIIRHYEIITKIKNTYDNFIEILKNNYKINFYDYSIQIETFLGFKKNNNNFNIIDKLNITVYCEHSEYAINIILSPSLNKLNYYEKIIDGIFDNFLLCNSGQNETNERYYDKKILTCYFTLESSELQIYDFKIYKDNIILKDCIKQFIMNKYYTYHVDIYNIYTYHNKNNENFIDILKKIKKNIKELIRFPEYIKIYIESILDDYESGENIDNRIEIWNNEKIFTEKMNKILEIKLNEFLEI